MSEIIFYGVEFLFHSALLMAMLWIMIKCQDMNYNFLGLLGTAAAGGALDMIPYVGHAFAVVTMYFCIVKMTRASMFPDASFTVAVSYALMFAVKMLTFTYLIGDLRPASMDRVNLTSDDPPPPRIAAAVPPANLPPPAPKDNAIADGFVRQFVIKGATRNGDKSSAIINFAGRTFTVFQGDTFSLPVDDKMVQVTLSNVDSQRLTFSINGEIATCAY
ncbi:MAG TPA: hypothetical protein VNX46_16945 [Candidatus Acidoferrum sp.]|nr:hypothetical protein [Candidatus Acidoferrum sp.]